MGLDKVKITNRDIREINFDPIISKNELSYNLPSEIIAEARLQSRPIVIVEGIDDIPIYENISELAGITIKVRAIETIKGYSEGSTHVKQFIIDAQETLNETSENEKYLLGIIDRDACFYRNELCEIEENKSILVLKYYSFESHFATKRHLEVAAVKTLISSAGLNEDLLDTMYRSYNEFLISELYYISLDALKNACIADYNSFFGYSASYGQIKNNPEQVEKVLKMRESLETYAAELGINNYEQKFSIIKGKWILESFVEKCYEMFNILAERCISNDLLQSQKRCDSCGNGVVDKCLWRPQKHSSQTMIKRFVLAHLDNEELRYIINRLKQLYNPVEKYSSFENT